MRRLVDKASRSSPNKCLFKTVVLWLQDLTKVKFQHSPFSKWSNDKFKFFKDQTFHLKKVSMHLISQPTPSPRKPKLKNRDKDKLLLKPPFNSWRRSSSSPRRSSSNCSEQEGSVKSQPRHNTLWSLASSHSTEVARLWCWTWMRPWSTVSSQSHSFKLVKPEAKLIFRWGSSLRADLSKSTCSLDLVSLFPFKAGSPLRISHLHCKHEHLRKPAGWHDWLR